MIGLMTLMPRQYNYGGFLQQLALQNTLQALGCQVEIIDYDPRQDTEVFSLRRSWKNITWQKLLVRAFYPVYQRNLAVRLLETSEAQQDAFDRCRARHLLLSQPYTRERLYSQTLPYQVLICGSDQVWNPDGCIPAFFLDFAPAGVRRIAYAASLGVSTISRRQRRIYRQLVAPFDAVSVREDAGKKIMQPLYPGPVEVTLDPTLLQTRQQWQQFAASSQETASDYLFCYFLNPTPDKIQAAQAFARQLGKQTLTLLYCDDPVRGFGDLKRPEAGPEDFVQLILRSGAVLTDSFHGAVFSLMFRKPVWVFPRTTGKGNMNSRIRTLLRLYGQEERFLLPEALKGVCFAPAEYDDTQIQQMRQQSLDFLRRAIGDDC